MTVENKPVRQSRINKIVIFNAYNSAVQTADSLWPFKGKKNLNALLAQFTAKV